MKQIDLIYKEIVLDNIKKDSILQSLIVEAEPFIKEAMKEFAWRRHKSLVLGLDNGENSDINFPYYEHDEIQLFDEWYNLLLNFRG